MVGNYGLSGFRDMKILEFWRQIMNLILKFFFWNFGQKWPKFWNFGGKIVNFHVFGLPEGVQTAIFKWKSSHFVHFDTWLESHDSQVFLDMKKKKTGAPYKKVAFDPCENLSGLCLKCETVSPIFGDWGWKRNFFKRVFCFGAFIITWLHKIFYRINNKHSIMFMSLWCWAIGYTYWS